MVALATEPIEFTLDGNPVEVPADGSLLDGLREHLGVRSVKDGCSPQGQCGCCTVWVDGQPRVACVTPVARVRGRAVTTVEGLPEREAWADAFARCGGSQCGFCTPGIIMRAAALDRDGRSPDAIGRALLAHLCRCTGWAPIVESIMAVGRTDHGTVVGSDAAAPDANDAARRARIEGGVGQSVGPEVALGRGGFADDSAPGDALVAVRSGGRDWVVGETLSEARAASGKVQGRRTTAPLSWPLAVPAGEWVRTLRTTWLEPAYLEPDASWCEPGGEPMSSLGNGGAFGGKVSAEVGAVARRLADEHGRTVRVLSTREDVVRFGPKRPPVAAGVAADGSGTLHAIATPGLAQVVAATAPEWQLVEFDVAGPPTSIALRGAGWVEIAVLVASLHEGPEYTVSSPSGATATAAIDDAGVCHVSVRCGAPLDETVLRSYCHGAAHMALGWVRSEGLSVDADGVPLDLTIRSFGILRAIDMPTVELTIQPDDAPPVNGSDAVFAAVATAAWSRSGWAPEWPTDR